MKFRRYISNPYYYLIPCIIRAVNFSYPFFRIIPTGFTGLNKFHPWDCINFRFPENPFLFSNTKTINIAATLKKKKKKNAFIIFPSYLPRAFVSFSREKNAFDILVYVINHTFERKFVILFQFIFRNVSIHVDTVFFLSSHKYRDCYIVL